MKKKSNKPTFIESDNGKKIRLCQEKGCLNEGEYEAPKSPNSKEKYFFCLHHIKIYNKIYSDEELREWTLEKTSEMRESIEGQEGLSAFLERRPPNWSPK